MKTAHRSLIGIVIVMITALAVVIVGQRNIVQANDEGCNASTIQGVYGFALSGLANPTFNGTPQQIGEFVPLAAAGTFPSMGMELLPDQLT